MAVKYKKYKNKQETSRNLIKNLSGNASKDERDKFLNKHKDMGLDDYAARTNPHDEDRSYFKYLDIMHNLPYGPTGKYMTEGQKAFYDYMRFSYGEIGETFEYIMNDVRTNGIPLDSSGTDKARLKNIETAIKYTETLKFYKKVFAQDINVFGEAFYDSNPTMKAAAKDLTIKLANYIDDLRIVNYLSDRPAMMNKDDIYTYLEQDDVDPLINVLSRDLQIESRDLPQWESEDDGIDINIDDFDLDSYFETEDEGYDV